MNPSANAHDAKRRGSGIFMEIENNLVGGNTRECFSRKAVEDDTRNAHVESDVAVGNPCLAATPVLPLTPTTSRGISCICT